MLAGRLAPEQIERLQAALDELGECRRLIDEALRRRLSEAEVSSEAQSVVSNA